MIDWDFNLLESLIQDRGDDVIHETAVSCPNCRLEDNYASNIYNEGQPATVVNGSPGCSQCYGSGWIFRNAQVVHGLLTKLKPGSNPQLAPGGFSDPGDCLFSPSLNAGPMVDWDKVTVPIAQPVGDGQTILRGSASIDDNITLNTGLASNEDRLWYLPSCVLWCEDQFGTVYTPGVDFKFNNKIIQWIGNSPKPRTVYTIKYQAYFEFIVFNTPLSRFDNNRSLAPAVYLRKSHVVFPNAYKIASPGQRIEEELNFTVK